MLSPPPAYRVLAYLNRQRCHGEMGGGREGGTGKVEGRDVERRYCTDIIDASSAIHCNEEGDMLIT